MISFNLVKPNYKEAKEQLLSETFCCTSLDSDLTKEETSFFNRANSFKIRIACNEDTLLFINSKDENDILLMHNILYINKLENCVGLRIIDKVSRIFNIIGVISSTESCANLKKEKSFGNVKKSKEDKKLELSQTKIERMVDEQSRLDNGETDEYNKTEEEWHIEAVEVNKQSSGLNYFKDKLLNIRDFKVVFDNINGEVSFIPHDTKFSDLRLEIHNYEKEVLETNYDDYKICMCHFNDRALSIKTKIFM